MFAGVTVLVTGTVWVIRQPGFGSLSLPGQRRAEPAALEAHVRFLTSTEPPRAWSTPSGLGIAADYIAQSLAGTGAAVSEQSYRVGPLEARNLRSLSSPLRSPGTVPCWICSTRGRVISSRWWAAGPIAGSSGRSRSASAVMITDTAFLRNPNYHTADDTAESLDYRRLAGVVDGVFCAVQHLSRAEP